MTDDEEQPEVSLTVMRYTDNSLALLRKEGDFKAWVCSTHYADLALWR